MFDGCIAAATALRPTVAPPFPLPAGASALWDSTKGVTLGAANRIQSWTDTIGSRVIAAPASGQRPFWGPDGGFFRGENVVQGNLLNSRCLFGQNLASLAGIGTFPFTLCLSRQRAKCLTGIAVHFAVDTLTTPASERYGYNHSARGNGAGTEYWHPLRQTAGLLSEVITGDIQDELTHVHQFFVSAAAGFTPTIDRTALGNVNSASAKTAMGNPHIHVGVCGSAAGSGQYGDVSVRILLHSTLQPSAPDLKEMIEWCVVWGGVI